MKNIIFSALLFSISNSSWGAWKRDTPSLEERIKKATYIFLGTPISERAEKVKDRDLDRVVIFSVSETFKGDPGKQMELHFLQVISPDSSNPDSGFRPNMRESFERSIKNSTTELVFVQEDKGLLVTAPEFGGGISKNRNVKNEIDELRRRKSASSQR